MASMTRKAAGGLGAVIGLCLAWAASAAMPDWTGLYEIVGGPTGQDRKLPGFTPVNEDLEPVVMAHLQPWAKAKLEATDTEADDTGAVCQLAGIFRHPTTVAGFQWLQTPGMMIEVSTLIQEVGVRRIHLTDHHPNALPATWDGHSIGHWEGDTLVVDTIGFNDKSWLMSGMEPHTEELHVVERIRQVADGAGLEVITTVDDRNALTGPYSYSRYYKKMEGSFAEATADGSRVCNGEPGEQQRWNTIRQKAIARQMNGRGAASAAVADGR